MKSPYYLITLLFLFNCTKEPVVDYTDSLTKDSITISAEPTINKNSEDFILKDFNDKVLKSLKEKDYNQFATFIHPEKGISFSMYGFINPKKDKHFTPAEFKKYISTDIKFTWGEKDGTGDLLQMSLKNYLEKWVFVKDFTQGEFSLNEIKHSGNTINNLKEVYPNSIFTENYLKGTKEYAEMDWNSLKLVFQEYKGKLFLVGIINNQWTI